MSGDERLHDVQGVILRLGPLVDANTKRILVTSKLVRSGRFQHHTSLLELCVETLQTHVLHRVLESSVTSICTYTVITLNQHQCHRDFLGILCFYESCVCLCVCVLYTSAKTKNTRRTNHIRKPCVGFVETVLRGTCVRASLVFEGHTHKHEKEK